MVGHWWLLWTFQKVIFQLQPGTAAALHCTAPSFSFFKYSWFQDSSSVSSSSSANSVTNIISNSTIHNLKVSLQSISAGGFILQKPPNVSNFVSEFYSWTTINTQHKISELQSFAEALNLAEKTKSSGSFTNVLEPEHVPKKRLQSAVHINIGSLSVRWSCMDRAR